MKTLRNAVIRLSAFSRSMYDAPRFVSRLGNLPPPWLLNFPIVHQSNRLEIYLKNSTERFFKISLIFITRVYGCFECITVAWILQFLLCFYLIYFFKIHKLRIQRMFQPSIVDKWKIIDYQYFRRISSFDLCICLIHEIDSLHENDLSTFRCIFLFSTMKLYARTM